jgi:hypothetical protein
MKMRTQLRAKETVESIVTVFFAATQKMTLAQQGIIQHKA